MVKVISTKTTVERATNHLISAKANVYMEAKAQIEMLVNACHTAAVANHWWHLVVPADDITGSAHNVPNQRNFGECIALIHSEVSEAMEGGRKDKRDDHLPTFTSVEVELADALIRIFDLAGAMDLGLGEAFVAKYLYNQERADHKIENRMAEGGKQF